MAITFSFLLVGRLLCGYILDDGDEECLNSGTISEMILQIHKGEKGVNGWLNEVIFHISEGSELGDVSLNEVIIRLAEGPQAVVSGFHHLIFESTERSDILDVMVDAIFRVNGG